LIVALFHFLCQANADLKSVTLQKYRRLAFQPTRPVANRHDPLSSQTDLWRIATTRFPADLTLRGIFQRIFSTKPYLNYLDAESCRDGDSRCRLELWPFSLKHDRLNESAP